MMKIEFFVTIFGISTEYMDINLCSLSRLCISLAVFEKKKKNPNHITTGLGPPSYDLAI